jgi:hypothetical protein
VRLLGWMTVLLVALPVSAQEGAGAHKARTRVHFNSATVVTVSGTVLGERRADAKSGAKAVHLVVKIGEDQVSVHLGPSTWVDAQKLKLAKGDEVVVKGSRFDYDGRYGVIAQTVTRGSESMTLRDASGKPMWANKKSTP